MPDITMCGSTNCENFEKCYRAQAKPDEYAQSYSLFMNTCMKNNYKNLIPYKGEVRVVHNSKKAKDWERTMKKEFSENYGSEY